ncbi:MAG TPA: DUF542 domain-containing protein, partial [Planctomycetota bacterium]|nr:DUF542 domain-containing protein [Planctomycetota bacterium]
MKHTPSPAPTPTPSTHLADLAVTRAGASRVFHRHGLDFCCHGHIPLAQACQAAGLDVQLVLAELTEEDRKSEGSFERWDERPIGELISHLLEDFHAEHRAELPRLLEMARKVEKVHGSKPT